MTQIQVPLHCPATASQRVAALHCLSDLVRVFRHSHGLGSAQGVGEWVISTTTGSEVTLRAAGMLLSCLHFDGRIRVQVSFSGQLLSLTPLWLQQSRPTPLHHQRVIRPRAIFLAKPL
ncbi:hypothetical protein J4Q44_G00350750 [Coregonus suidteri]|uniref:Uncharacterized protein n=1 Tax=Coregonus suidteri TaxID=861788 RepID=A0AAN8Q7P8_9TELE